MSLNVQLLIYIYMAISVSVLIFNVVYILTDRKRAKRKEGTGRQYAVLKRNLEKSADLCELPEKYHRKLQRRLARTVNMEHFDAAMQQLLLQMPKESEHYLQLIEKDFIRLADTYHRKEDIEQAYFARLVENYKIGDGREYDRLKRVLVEMMKSNSVYSRENALRALYRMGNIEAVCRAYENMSRNGIAHYGKMLTDGLLRFNGDKQALAQELWIRRSHLQQEYQLAVMRFIRMSQKGYEEEFAALIVDENEDREFRLEAIRYFRKNYYEKVRSVLLDILRNRGKLDWEYAAMAALSLENYPGKETVAVLKSALTSSNWYVRYNAAEVLVGKFKISYLELSDIYNGRDRYAREILMYMRQRYDLNSGEGTA